MDRDSIIISEVTDAAEKQDSVREILADLPEWFGLPESTQSYIEESKTALLWSAETNGETIGFVTLTETTEDTGEVHCMGIKKRYHRKGIGGLLMEALEQSGRETYTYLQVKTVDQGHYKEYDQTIAFYQSKGFSKLEVFPTLWDEWNPCLIMVKKL